ncbi:MAG TPA: hypothetical protein VD996_06060 [Chitinophagaceae bacterium]|nr:hypothetical protein [Chitinophagaceae bacterium]
MTQHEFYQHICSLPEKWQNRDLETYLCALLRLVEEHKDYEINDDKLLFLLEEAFTADPLAFNPAWLSLVTAPEDDNGIGYTIGVLKFQIAELHKMKGKQLQFEMKYFGITSETGNIWYNFDPFTNLECGARCLIGGDGTDNDDEELVVNWRTLGELLEMGRTYE